MNRFLLLTFALLLKFSEALSCSCNSEFSEFTPVYLTTYNRILVCKPINVETTDDHVTYYTALVSKTYWGKKQDTILLATSLANGMCGFPLKLNIEYLIYGEEIKDTISF